VASLYVIKCRQSRYIAWTCDQKLECRRGRPFSLQIQASLARRDRPIILQRTPYSRLDRYIDGYTNDALYWSHHTRISFGISLGRNIFHNPTCLAPIYADWFVVVVPKCCSVSNVGKSANIYRGIMRAFPQISWKMYYRVHVQERILSFEKHGDQ